MPPFSTPQDSRPTIFSTTAGSPIPKNVKAKRYLDCAVINHLHKLVLDSGESPYDTVRGLFPDLLPVEEAVALMEVEFLPAI